MPHRRPSRSTAAGGSARQRTMELFLETLCLTQVTASRGLLLCIKKSPGDRDVAPGLQILSRHARWSPLLHA